MGVNPVAKAFTPANATALFEDAYGRTNAQAGQICGEKLTVTTLALTAARIYLVRFVPSRAMTIASIAYSVTTAAGSDDAVDVGIYNSDLTSRLASSGSTTGQLNGTGVKNISLTAPLAVTAGTVYYAALVGAVATSAATITGASSLNTNVASIFGASAPQCDALFLTAGGGPPLPTSITPTGAISITAFLAVRE